MSEPGVDKPSYASLFGRLLQDGEDFARARVNVYKALAALRAAQMRNAAGLAFAALFLLEAALVVLLVGILLAIAACIGFVWATLIVTVGAFALAGGLLLLARRALPDFDASPLDQPVVIPEETQP